MEYIPFIRNLCWLIIVSTISFMAGMKVVEANKRRQSTMCQALFWGSLAIGALTGIVEGLEQRQYIVTAIMFLATYVATVSSITQINLLRKM